MESLGVPELLIILAIVLIMFGPGRLAGLGRALGDTIRTFRHEVREQPTEPPAEQQSVQDPPEPRVIQ